MKNKTYFFSLVFFCLPFFLYSQHSQEQIIKDGINQLNGLTATSKNEEKRIVSLSNELYHLSKNAGHKKGMLISLCHLAQIYSNNGEINECLKVVGEGLSLAEELKSYFEYAGLLNTKGKALSVAENYSDSRISFSKALRISDLITDKDQKYMSKAEIYVYLISYAESEYNRIGKVEYKDSMLYFAKKSYDQSLKVSERKYSKKKLTVGQSAKILGQVYVVYHHNYKEGERYFNMAEKLVSNESDKRYLADLYNARGFMNFQEGNDEKALEYYQKALELSRDFNYSSLAAGVYDNLVKYYRKTKDVKKELYFLNKSMTLKDSLSKIHKKALITQSRHDINLTSRKQQSGYSIWSILVTIVPIILIGSLLYYFLNKNKTKKLSQSNDLDYDLQKNNIDEDKIASLLEMAKNNDKQFLIIFQEVFADLYKELLKFPELTSADLEMCVYLKLNIQTKEIATYKKTSIGAVDNRKYRIRKKLNLVPETDLYKWINTII
ncbi:MAG: tetratricopeptide repeat protein [Chryseobacterium jejuense]|uniref:tetratricopeptide repeat protein n=1 Tax=Chryseobacterium jejuense TaxID=445960 RepID=UPI003D0C0434